MRSAFVYRNRNFLPSTDWVKNHSLNVHHLKVAFSNYFQQIPRWLDFLKKQFPNLKSIILDFYDQYDTNVLSNYYFPRNQDYLDGLDSIQDKLDLSCIKVQSINLPSKLPRPTTTERESSGYIKPMSKILQILLNATPNLQKLTVYGLIFPDFSVGRNTKLRSLSFWMNPGEYVPGIAFQHFNPSCLATLLNQVGDRLDHFELPDVESIFTTFETSEYILPLNKLNLTSFVSRGASIIHPDDFIQSVIGPRLTSLTLFAGDHCTTANLRWHQRVIASEYFKSKIVTKLYLYGLEDFEKLGKILISFPSLQIFYVEYPHSSNTGTVKLDLGLKIVGRGRGLYHFKIDIPGPWKLTQFFKTLSGHKKMFREKSKAINIY